MNYSNPLPRVDIIEISPTTNDNCYEDLRARVQQTPERYPQLKIEYNLLSNMPRYDSRWKLILRNGSY
jgi:hypothetical protein